MSDYTNRKYYDESFAEVFSNQKVVASLLQDFIEEPWVRKICFGSMTIERSLFKEISQQPRSNDLLVGFRLPKKMTGSAPGDNPVSWPDDASVKTSENDTVIPLYDLRVFLLIEFQSTPEDMRRRIFEYRSRLHSRLLEQGGAAAPVVPIVIYNGKERWKENPQDSGTHSDYYSFSGGLEKYVPNLRYILIDEQRYSDAELLERGSPAASFFYLDKADLKNREAAVNRIIDTLNLWKGKDWEIYDLLKRYILGLMQYKGVEITEITDYTDERGIPMLAQSMDELIEQGKEEGLAQGKEQGELLEKRKVLVRQLHKRFGLTDEETALVMAETSREKLDHALDEILFTDNKEQVLEGFMMDL